MDFDFDQDDDQSTTKRKQSSHDTTPYLYRVLVVDFFNNLANHTGLPFEELFDVDYFLQLPCPITSENILSSSSRGGDRVFDKWFVRCCRNPFVIERAWSLVSTLNMRKFGYYANLVLCKNVDIRYKFAELCACIYFDTKIETSTWKFSIHNLEDENKNIMTKTKKEIQQHENRKAQLFTFFRSDNNPNLTIQHVPFVGILTNVAFGTQSHYKDVSVDAYNFIIDACITKTKEADAASLLIGFNESRDDWSPRYRLSVLEKGAANQLLGDPSDKYTFYIDELGVISSVGRLVGPAEASTTLPDLNVIMKDPLMSILFATAVGYAHRTRHTKGSMVYVPNSMQKRIKNAKLSVEIQLARIYTNITSAITKSANRMI